MEKELEYEGEEDGSDNDYEEINPSAITKSEAEEIFEISFSLAQTSLFDIVKNSQNSFLQCHALAKVNANNMLDAKSNLECYFSNLLKNKSESTQKTIKNLHLQSSVIARIKNNLVNDFDNLSDGLSSKLFDNENKHIERNGGNNQLELQNMTNSNFENDRNRENINIKLENISKIEDDFDLIKANDITLSYEEANHFDLLS